MNLANREMAGLRHTPVPSPTPPPTNSSRATSTASPVHVWKSVSSQHRKSSRAVRVYSILYHVTPSHPFLLCILTLPWNIFLSLYHSWTWRTLALFVMRTWCLRTCVCWSVAIASIERWDLWLNNEYFSKAYVLILLVYLFILYCLIDCSLWIALLSFFY